MTKLERCEQLCNTPKQARILTKSNETHIGYVITCIIDMSTRDFKIVLKTANDGTYKINSIDIVSINSE